MNRYDVVIIGAGVVGLSCALVCARQGLTVAIVEANTLPAWQADQADLRVYALALDNQKLFEQLDVWSEIKAKRINPYHTMTVFDEVNDQPLQFTASELGRQTLGYIVEHNVLVESLWHQALLQKNITLLCPDKIQGLTNDEKDVEIHLFSGRVLSAKILIGADGARSKVRELVGIESNVHDYHQKGLVAFIKTELPHQHTAWQRFLSTGPLAFLPFTDKVCSIVWTLPNERAEQLLQIDAESFCQALDTAFVRTLGKVELISERAVFPLKRQLAKTMMQGRTLLIGDAAHSVHPLAGQGVNLGLRDVTELQKFFNHAHAQQSDLLALNNLQRWARQRYSDNAMAAYVFENINRVFSNDQFAMGLIRGHMLGFGNRLTPFKNAMARYAAGI
ncbi:MAG: FAD-dependent oxidoreductase [Arenimonas sp.]|nr:FAD-dependent oxidoreductase [Arenimonas sp.]